MRSSPTEWPSFSKRRIVLAWQTLPSNSSSPGRKRKSRLTGYCSRKLRRKSTGQPILLMPSKKTATHDLQCKITLIFGKLWMPEIPKRGMASRSSVANGVGTILGLTACASTARRTLIGIDSWWSAAKSDRPGRLKKGGWWNLSAALFGMERSIACAITLHGPGGEPLSPALPAGRAAGGGRLSVAGGRLPRGRDRPERAT